MCYLKILLTSSASNIRWAKMYATFYEQPTGAPPRFWIRNHKAANSNWNRCNGRPFQCARSTGFVTVIAVMCFCVHQLLRGLAKHGNWVLVEWQMWEIPHRKAAVEARIFDSSNRRWVLCTPLERQCKRNRCRCQYLLCAWLPLEYCINTRFKYTICIPQSFWSECMQSQLKKMKKREKPLRNSLSTLLVALEHFWLSRTRKVVGAFASKGVALFRMKVLRLPKDSNSPELYRTVAFLFWHVSEHLVNSALLQLKFAFIETWWYELGYISMPCDSRCLRHG